MSLNELFQTGGVKRALIVDDFYDEVPKAQDLSLDADEWTQFFDDLNEGEKGGITDVFPQFAAKRADELSSDDAFVAILWRNKDNLRPEVIAPLFERYQTDRASDEEYLNVLLTRLEAFGLECTTAGRDFDKGAQDADLIVIDLFLGSAQDEFAINNSIEGLKRVIDARPGTPPLILLMSRSPRLEEKRREFRDEVGLFETGFRIIRKSELSDEGKLQRVLSRLATHFPDSRKLAAFHHAWQEGLSNARQRTSKLIRTLDLADLAQIQQLLLSAEGEPVGSYLVDVFDLVLQHEIERDAATIDAAIQLNSINVEQYPPPYVGGSPDLQILVYRSLFQNRGRYRLSEAKDGRVAFGQVLRRKPIEKATEPVLEETKEEVGSEKRLSLIGRDDVLLVLTPACDLQRGAAPNILMLKGTLLPLQPVSWSYEETPVRTPVIETADGLRYWIKWDLKHVETVSQSEMAKMLEAGDGFSVIARVRESHALELQQKLLSNLGRVGLIAQMPATFPMRVSAYLPDANRKLFQLNTPVLTASGGVCFIGRSGVKDMHLTLPEDACEEIFAAISAVDLDSVHQDARPVVTRLRESGELLSVIEKGIVIPGPQAQGLKEIEFLEASPGEGAAVKKTAIALVVRAESAVGMELSSGQTRKAGVVLAVAEPN